MCEGSKAIQSTTASKDSFASARETAAGSLISAVTVRTAAGTAPIRSPRLSTVSSIPRSMARSVQALLMIPVPPMKSTRMKKVVSDAC